jgi:hypothetical protein
VNLPTAFQLPSNCLCVGPPITPIGLEHPNPGWDRGLRSTSSRREGPNGPPTKGPTANARASARSSFRALPLEERRIPWRAGPFVVLCQGREPPARLRAPHAVDQTCGRQIRQTARYGHSVFPLPSSLWPASRIQQSARNAVPSLVRPGASSARSPFSFDKHLRACHTVCVNLRRYKREWLWRPAILSATCG